MNKLLSKLRLPAILLALFSSFNSLAQEYLMNSSTNGTTITTCSGTLYDSGGASGDYQTNENYTLTIYSENGVSGVSLYFSEFNIEYSYDKIVIYDGDSETSPILVENASGHQLLEETVTSTGPCITINFTSDASSIYSGFCALISCHYDCQSFFIDIGSVSPELLFSEQNMTNLCQGDEIVFSAVATFPENDIYYHQSMASTKWHWLVSSNNGSPIDINTGVNNELLYEAIGIGYKTIGLYAVDTNGCVSHYSDLIILRHSSYPDFSGSIVSDQVCLGESVTLFPHITSDTCYYYNEFFGIDEQVCVGDYVGVWRSVGFTFNLNDQSLIVNDASDIESICLKVEHSYISDLQLRVVCPNSQSAMLFDQSCFNTQFGFPNQESDCVPGNGWDYCWTMTAGSLMSESCNSGSSIPSGSYLPVESFESLIGCPVNGNWYIEFKDDRYMDDGTIFTGNINFAAGFIPEQQEYVYFVNTFDTTLNSSDVFWSGPGVVPGLLYQEAVPEEIGEFDYLLSATNDFGCTFLQAFPVIIYNTGNPLCDPFCNSMVYETTWDTISDGSEEYLSQDNTACSWLIINSEKSESDIFLYWNYYDVYAGDYVRFYSGNSDMSPLLFEFTGNSNIPDSFVIPGNEAYITYITDGSLRSPGWELVYQTVPTGSPINTLGEVSIYPNPSNGLFNVSGLAEPAKLSVIDMSGRIVMQIIDFENSTLNISNLQSGMYFIRIEGDGSKMHKILKQ